MSLLQTGREKSVPHLIRLVSILYLAADMTQRNVVCLFGYLTVQTTSVILNSHIFIFMIMNLLLVSYYVYVC